MDTTAALLRSPGFSLARPQPVGARLPEYYYLYNMYAGPACAPESVRAVGGILTGVVLAALIWVPILWLIL